MFIYLSIFFLAFLGILLPRRNHEVYLLLLCVILLFFVGLRFEIGGDWSNYLFRYRLMHYSPNYLSTFSIAEPGYAFLNYYIGGKTPMAYINFICAFFLFLGLFVYLKDQPNPMFSLLIALPYMIFVNGMGYTRQATALGFILLALFYIANRRFIAFIFFIICAAMFHKTALIILAILPFYFIDEKNLKKFLPLIIVGAVLFFISISKLNNLFEAYGEDSTFESGGGLYRHIMNAIPSILFLLNLNFFKKAVPKYFTVLFYLAIGSLFLLLVSFKLSTFSDRLGQFFAIIQISVWPIFLSKFSLRDRIPLGLLIISFYLIFMIYWFQNSEFSKCCWINYKNYLFLN
ncbi:EpsG family protein [Chryseobacterium taklimakanense]|nr:EpsG family protein [Chryseobacterium taklimakanense]